MKTRTLAEKESGCARRGGEGVGERGSGTLATQQYLETTWRFTSKRGKNSACLVLNDGKFAKIEYFHFLKGKTVCEDKETAQRRNTEETIGLEGIFGGMMEQQTILIGDSNTGGPEGLSFKGIA